MPGFLRHSTALQFSGGAGREDRQVEAGRLEYVCSPVTEPRDGPGIRPGRSLGGVYAWSEPNPEKCRPGSFRCQVGLIGGI